MISDKFFINSLWFLAVVTVLQSCLEGDGLGLDSNGYCNPVDSFSLSICPELCNPGNKDHVCYCDTTDINGTCLACDVTVPTETCYDSCQTKVGDPANPSKLMLKDTCLKQTDTTRTCQKDPMNPCTPECASLRTIDYTTKIAPIWEANACVTGCHLRGNPGFQQTGNAAQITVRQGGKDTTVYKGLSYQPDLNALSMMINVPMYSDSGNPNVPFWRVRPFYPDSSYLVRILSAANGTFVRMPNAQPPIPATSLNDIKQWIKEGACPEK